MVMRKNCGKDGKSMCGRFTLYSPLETLRQIFGFEGNVNFAPRYNIAPTNDVPVIGLKKDSATTGIAMMRWGLIPRWAEDEKIAYKMINARAETIDAKPAYAPAFEKRRCIIPADSFYEWLKTDDGKVPYNIRRADLMPMGMAGIWENWKDPQSGQLIHSFAIITCPANKTIKGIHERMPVVLEQDSWAEWLASDTSVTAARAMLRPCDNDLLEAYEINPRVGNVANDDAALIEPLQSSW